MRATLVGKKCACTVPATQLKNTQTIQIDLIKKKLLKQDIIQTFKLISKGSEYL